MRKGLKKHFPDIQFSGNKVTRDEIEHYEQYCVINPTINATYIGTAAAGTAGQTKSLTFDTSAYLDYPRNLLYSVQGTNDIGGTWTVSGKDQFGSTVSETVGFGTAAAGTPAASSAGTQIFAKVTGGTFTIAGTGNGIGRVGVAIGTASPKFLFGLPNRIGTVTDVKTINWSDESGQVVPINKGSVQSSTYVDATNHAFTGTTDITGTTTYVVWYKPTYNPEGDSYIADL